MAEQEETKRKVAICTPISRQVESDFTRSILATAARMSRIMDVAWFNVTGHANLPRARNVLTGQALAMGYTDIVFIDADIGWEPESFEALFRVPDDVEIVAGCPQRRDDEKTTFCGRIDDDQSVAKQMNLSDGRVLLSGHAATAFLRVKREAFEKLRESVEEFDYDGTMYGNFFFYKIGLNPSKTSVGYIGEDYYFCDLARDNGITVWLDPSIKLRHWHSQPLTATMIDHLEFKEPENEH